MTRHAVNSSHSRPTSTHHRSGMDLQVNEALEDRKALEGQLRHLQAGLTEGQEAARQEGRQEIERLEARLKDLLKDRSVVGHCVLSFSCIVPDTYGKCFGASCVVHRTSAHHSETRTPPRKMSVDSLWLFVHARRIKTTSATTIKQLLLPLISCGWPCCHCIPGTGNKRSWTCRMLGERKRGRWPETLKASLRPSNASRR